jgi:hypothetical protein
MEGSEGHTSASGVIRSLSRGHNFQKRPKSISPAPINTILTHQNSTGTLGAIGRNGSMRSSSPGIVRNRHILHHQPSHHVLYEPKAAYSPKLPTSKYAPAIDDITDEVVHSPFRSSSPKIQFKDRQFQQRPKTTPNISKTSGTFINSSVQMRAESTNKIPLLQKTPLEKLGDLTQLTLSSRYIKQLTCSVTAVQQIPKNYVFSEESDESLFSDHCLVYHSVCHDMKHDSIANIDNMKKRDVVYSVFKDILQEFRNYEQLIEASGPGMDSQVAKTVSYAHPEDLFQICCYLYAEKSLVEQQVKQLNETITIQRAQIASYAAEKASETEFDLFKVRPSKSDIEELEASIQKIESDIRKEDPAILKEIMAMKEDTRELEERIKTQTELHLSEQDVLKNAEREAVPVLPDLTRPQSVPATTSGERRIHSAKSVKSAGPARLKKLNSFSNSFRSTKSTSTSPGGHLATVDDYIDDDHFSVYSLHSDFENHDAVDEAGVKHYVKLIREKLKLLEDYVMVMKKKTQRVEQTDEDLKNLVTNFGSIESLLRENDRLKKEINFFNWVTKRFDHDLLLKHEYLYIDDIPLLRAVIFAMQNEIFCMQQQLKFYNLEENSSLKLQIIQSNPEINNFWPEEEKIHTLEYLMTELFMDEKLKMDYERKKQVKEMVAKELEQKGLPSKPEQEIDLRQNIKMLETENEVLKAQQKRVKQEMAELRRTIELLSETNTVKKRTDVKERENFIKQLNNKIASMNKICIAKENHYVFQEELSKSLTKKKNLLYQQNANLAAQNMSLREDIKSLRAKLRLQSNGMETLYLITVSSLFSILSDSMKNDEGFRLEHSVQCLYRDSLQSFMVATRAAMRIQSWIRGVRTRRKLLRDGFYTILVTNTKKRKEERDKLQLPYLPAKQARQALKAKNNNETTRVSSERDLLTKPDNFSNIYNFLKAMMAVKDGAHLLDGLNQMVRVIRDEVIVTVKSEVTTELSRMQQEMDQKIADIQNAVHTATNIGKTTKSTQTVQLQTRERSIQCGVTQFSHIEIR